MKLLLCLSLAIVAAIIGIVLCLWQKRDRSIRSADAAIIAEVQAQARSASAQAVWAPGKGLDIDPMETIGRRVVFADGSWVKLAGHSAHMTRDYGFPGFSRSNAIGDFDYRYAIDPAGTAWTNIGHVCDGPLVGPGEGIASSADFLVRTTIEGHPWVRLAE